LLRIEKDRPPATPRDAATVILLREEASGFSVFMVRRHAKSGFMAGAYVFPGGTLDANDGAPSVLAHVAGRDEEAAARALGEDDGRLALALHVAALRETFEEAGVLLADGVDERLAEEARRRLVAKEVSFEELVSELRVRLRADALTPLSRWITPEVEPRRYDARFFLARAPAAQRAAHDRVEVTAGEWLRPHEALARGARGEIQLAPPTLRTLECLAAFASVDEAIADAASRRPPLVRPVFVDLGATWALALPGDPAHPERDRVLPGPTRFMLVDGVFRSVDPA
jgi:8-oxo-dGTP pyrophosphatase MutT (NUDIX family)